MLTLNFERLGSDPPDGGPGRVDLIRCPYLPGLASPDKARTQNLVRLEARPFPRDPGSRSVSSPRFSYPYLLTARRQTGQISSPETGAGRQSRADLAPAPLPPARRLPERARVTPKRLRRIRLGAPLLSLPLAYRARSCRAWDVSRCPPPNPTHALGSRPSLDPFGVKGGSAMCSILPFAHSRQARACAGVVQVQSIAQPALCLLARPCTPGEAGELWPSARACASHAAKPTPPLCRSVAAD